MFGNLGTAGLEKAEDRLGGFAPLETNSYDATIKQFYAVKSDGGANGIQVIADIGGKEYRELVWITNRKGENFFLNKNDNTKKVPLPGFTTINDMCLVVTGKEISQLAFEEKVVKIYDYDAKAELPKSVPVCMDMIGGKVTLGISNTLENKTEKKGSDYVAIADTRNVNAIEKVFDTETKLTVLEATLAAESGKPAEAVFHPAWVERNAGVTKDKREIKDGSAGKPAGAPQAATASSSVVPKTSLFNKG